MVHGLRTIRRLDAEAVKRAGKRGPTRPLELPGEIALSPASIRAFTNRPWTKAELGDQPCVYESYAKSAAEPFRGKGAQEGLRA